ncbi:MAG: hypothetical protein GY816_02235 [Cytophagales bacterium]|nr:hypothetical protein [Cytophagales bacterium]
MSGLSRKLWSRGVGSLAVCSVNTEGPIEIEIKFREKALSPLITYFLAIDEESVPVVERKILKKKLKVFWQDENQLSCACYS